MATGPEPIGTIPTAVPASRLAPPGPGDADAGRYRALLGRLAQGFCVLRVAEGAPGDADAAPALRVVEVNDAFERQVGAAALVGRSLHEIVPVAAHAAAACVRVARSGEAACFSGAFTGDDRWHHVAVLPFDPADPALVALLVEDVTERRRTEAQLRASEERFRHSQDAGRIGVFEWNRDSGTWWSDAQWRLYGRDPAEHGDPEALFAESVHPDDRPALDAVLARCLAGELETIRHELRIVRPGGSLRWIEIVAEVTARDDDGRPVRVAGVNIDVTDRVLVAEALRETEERFRIMADGLPHIVWVHDETGALRFVNRTYCDFFGVTQAQVTGEGWIPLTHPDEAPAYAAAFREAVAERRPFSGRVRVRDRHGEWRLIESTGRPRFAADGAYLGHVGASVDVTEAHRAAAEREELARQRQLALDAARLGWFHMQPLAGTGTSDARVAEIFGVERPGAPLSDFVERIHPDDRARVVAAIEAAVDATRAEPYAITYRVLHPDHGLRWVEAFGRAEFADPDAPVATSFIGTVADVTERKAGEEALREADRRKDEFLAMLAHELRNPLAPVRHAVEILRRVGSAEPPVQRARDIIDRQVSHMARLIDDLLDVSRIARGRIQLRTERTDLAAIVREVAESYRPAMAAADVALAVDAADATWVDGDPTRLAQVIGNVLHNASKFTPPGGAVAVRLDPDAAASLARLEVRDTGRGIDPALLPSLFEPFSQGEQALDRSHGGLGLGLALVRGLVTMHGGRVAAQSEGEGRGATFTIELPLAQGAPAEPVALADAAGGGAAPARVLVVEDNRDGAEMLHHLLALAAHDVRVAHDGHAALAEAHAWRPDAIVCDIGLPGTLDGYAIARAVRADPALAATWLVALSGYGQDADRRLAQAAGFDRHVVKPADFTTLDAALAARSRRDEGLARVSSPASPGR